MKATWSPEGLPEHSSSPASAVALLAEPGVWHPRFNSETRGAEHAGGRPGAGKTPAAISGGSPRGRHHIRVCRGTACHVKGSAAVLETLQQELGIAAGEVTADGGFSLEVVACLDACGMAPVIAVGDQIYPGMTPNQVESLIATLRD